MRLPAAPIHDYEQIRKIADNFLDRHWPEATAPIDIEKIVDARLGLDVIPYPGLQREIGVEGFLAHRRDAIYVDAGVSETVPVRYRFTLAHEVGHLVLHGALYEAVRFESPAQWLAMQAALPDRERGWFEWQANAFAGLVLAPRDPLASALAEGMELAGRRGFDVDLRVEAHRESIASWVGRRLNVSAAVILRRGRYDGLWSDG